VKPALGIGGGFLACGAFDEVRRVLRNPLLRRSRLSYDVRDRAPLCSKGNSVACSNTSQAEPAGFSGRKTSRIGLTRAVAGKKRAVRQYFRRTA